MEKVKVKSFWDLLKEQYSFKQHVYEIPISRYEELREEFLPNFWLKWFPVKKLQLSSDDWMDVTINGNYYEVMIVDIWYVALKRNGVVIFDKRRFEDKEYLSLLV